MMGDSEHINEAVETVGMLVVSAIKQLTRNDLMSTPYSITYKRKETV